MFIYRVENLEELKTRGGFYNNYTKIDYSASYKGDKSIPRLYFFKDMPEKLESYYDNNIINYLESLADDQDAYHKIKKPYGEKLREKYFYPIRFKSLPNFIEHFDKEWSSNQILYYYEFNKDEPQKIIVSIDNIEYYDKNKKEWIKII